MHHFENKHMSELIKLGVKSWDRFVDDTFVIIKGKENAIRILNYLNEQHITIKFTMDLDKEISFLYVKIIVGNFGEFEISKLFFLISRKNSRNF